MIPHMRIQIMLAEFADSVLTYDPDHASPRLGFIQSVQILAKGGNDGLVLETNRKLFVELMQLCNRF